MSTHFSPDAVIDALGGTAEVARLCHIEPQAVSQWRHRGIPPARLMFLRLLRPELFAAVDTKRPAPSPAGESDPQDAAEALLQWQPKNRPSLG